MICVGAWAQEPTCRVELPVLVILPDGALVQRLGPEGFVGRNMKGPVPLESVETERGARRILFVVETGKHVPEAARKIEAAVISEILSKASPEDAFGLLTTHGPRKEIRFQESREALQAAVNEIEEGMKGKNQEDGVLDSLFEGADWFQPGRTGDAIVVLTMGIEKNHQVSFVKVRDRLAGAGIRLFGLQLGMLISGYIQGGIGMGPGGQMIPTASISANQESLFALSMDTGGFASLENAEGDPQKRYKLTGERLRGVRYIALQEYKAVVEYYRIRVQSPPKETVLDLADPIRKQLPQAMVIYPKSTLMCPQGANPSKR
jgi:hypothetical protein